MATRHADRHLTQICDLLALETIQISLNSRAGVLEVLRGKMQRVLQLKGGTRISAINSGAQHKSSHL
jgi:hypothetical protein